MSARYGRPARSAAVSAPRRQATAVTLAPLRAFAALVLLAIAALIFTACAATPAKPTPTHAYLSATAAVNPDANGRASPIVVRLFQLRNDGEFAAADFFALYGKEKETLASTLISREEYVLAPGETRTIDLALDPQARVIGALAAFRDIRSAHWRALTQAPERKLTDLLGKDSLILVVDQDSVTLSLKD